MFSSFSKKFARYDDALAARRATRSRGYKTGHIYKDWQGMYAYGYVAS